MSQFILMTFCALDHSDCVQQERFATARDAIFSFIRRLGDDETTVDKLLSTLTVENEAEIERQILALPDDDFENTLAYEFWLDRDSLVSTLTEKDLHYNMERLKGTGGIIEHVYITAGQRPHLETTCIAASSRNARGIGQYVETNWSE